MWILETIAVSVGMYSALPIPQIEWNEKNMRYAMAAFPLVGLVIALAYFGWFLLCQRWVVPVLLRGAGFCALPALVTGGIHLDGYADTSDALASHAPAERKQEILRDPHCGAFAVIRLILYFIGYFSLCCVWKPTITSLFSVGLTFFLSRVVSGLSLTIFPVAPQSSLVRVFAGTAEKKRVRFLLLLELLVCVIFLCVIDLWRAVLLLSTGMLVFGRYAYAVKYQFGGLSGDLAGWFLVKAEFWMFAVQVLSRYGGK